MARHLNSTHTAVAEAFASLQMFGGADLTSTLKQIEESLRQVTLDRYDTVLSGCGAKAEILGTAGTIKRLAGQVNVIIHALGILLCLPHILRPDEVIRAC